MAEFAPLQGNPVLNALNNINQATMNAIQKQYMPQQIQADIGLKNAEINQYPFKNALLSAQTNLANSQADSRPYLDMLRQLKIAQMTGGGNNAINSIPGVAGLSGSLPTKANMTYLQRAALAAQQLQELLPDIAKGQAPYLGASGKAQHALDSVRNVFGFGNSESLNRQQGYNTSEADLNTAAEMLVKAFGLNATNENYKHMREVVEPRKYESPEIYNARIMGELSKLSKRQGQYQDVIQQGYQVGGNNEMTLPQTPQQINKLQNTFAGVPLTIEQANKNSKTSSVPKVRKYNPATGKIE
jgi:hypothetical protein